MEGEKRSVCCLNFFEWICGVFSRVFVGFIGVCRDDSVFQLCL